MVFIPQFPHRCNQRKYPFPLESSSGSLILKLHALLLGILFTVAGHIVHCCWAYCSLLLGIFFYKLVAPSRCTATLTAWFLSYESYFSFFRFRFFSELSLLYFSPFFSHSFLDILPWILHSFDHNILFQWTLVRLIGQFIPALALYDPFGVIMCR